MECDNCGNKNESDLIFGRWIIYCKKCKKSGEEKDQNLFYENECCNGERLDELDMLDGEACEMLEKVL